MRRAIAIGLFIFFTVSITTKAQVTIGSGDPPKNYSILEIDATHIKGGIRLPQITTAQRDSLTALTALDPEANGLTIYNDVINSIEYWNGSEWRRINDASGLSPTIINLDCSNAALYPNQYTSGTPYNGAMTIPYIGGNGAAYPQGTTLGPVNGLYYTRQAGILNNGSGEVKYTVSGTPTVSSPTTTSFNIDFLGQSCIATVGTTNVVKTMIYAKNTVSPIDTNTPSNSVTSIGNISVRFNTTSPTGSNRIEFLSTTPNHISWVYHKAGSGGTGFEFYGQATSTGATTSADWKNFGQDLNVNNRDIGYVILTFHNTKEIYRITVNANGNINLVTGVPAVTSSVTIFVERLE